MVDFAKQIEKIQREMLKLEKLWELKGFKPNPGQEAAIRHVDGPLYLTAGPGSGKTRVLLWRTVNLIVFHGVEPEEIFLSTFTEKAAHQLKEGLQELLSIATNITGKPYDLAQMYIGTVHSQCQRMLSDRWRFENGSGPQTPPSLLDALGQYFHVSRRRNWEAICKPVLDGDPEDANLAVNQLFGEQRQAKHNAVSNCIKFFNRASEECIDPDEAMRALKDPNKDLERFYEEQGIDLENLATIFEMYKRYRESLKPNVRER